MGPEEPNLTPEVLELLRVAEFEVCSGGYDRILLDEAIRSAERARLAREAANRVFESGATASAVLCAAAACEARVSEYLAHLEFASGPLSDEMKSIRREPDARKQWRALVKSRAPEFDLGGCREYLHLGCLIRLRDLVAHRNARFQKPGEVPTLIADCVRQGVIPSPQSDGSDWPSVVLISPVALWGVETAARWLELAEQLVPIHC